MSSKELLIHEDIAERYINFVSEYAIPHAISRSELIKATNADPKLIEVTKWVNGKPHGEMGKWQASR